MAQGSRDIAVLRASAKSWKPMLPMALAGLAVGVVSIIGGLAVVPYFIALVLTIALVKYPEVFLTLFVFAGIFKAHPALSLPLNLDWTGTMGLAAVFLAFLRAALTKRNAYITITRADLFLAGLTFVLVFGLVYSRDRSYGAQTTAEFLFLGVLASYYLPRIIAGFCQPVKMVKNTLTTIVLLAGVTTLLTLSGLSNGNRAFAGSHLWWSYFLGVAILSGLSLWEVSSSKLLKSSIAIFIPLFLVAMIMAQARGPLIALAAIGALIFLCKGQFSIRRKMLLAVSALVVFGVLVTVLPHDFWWPYGLLFAEQKGPSIEGRLRAYRLAIRLFVEHPVLGVGTGSFRTFYDPLGSQYALAYPHNAILQAAAENGIPGLVSYVGVIMSLLLVHHRISKDRSVPEVHRKLAYGCLLGFLFLLFGSQMSGDIMWRWELFFAGLIVLLGVEGRRLHRGEDQYESGES